MAIVQGITFARCDNCGFTEPAHFGDSLPVGWYAKWSLSGPERDLCPTCTGVARDAARRALAERRPAAHPGPAGSLAGGQILPGIL